MQYDRIFKRAFTERPPRGDEYIVLLAILQHPPIDNLSAVETIVKLVADKLIRAGSLSGLEPIDRHITHPDIPHDPFVDESIRGQRYLMGCVLIEARDLAATRAAIGVLPTRGRRLHFNNEVDAQKRILLASIAELPVRAFVVVCHRRHGITEFIAREACLAALVSEVQSQRVDRLVLESRQDDREDARIISKLRQPEPPLVFEHRTARREAMLGIADGITWAAGAGAHWQALIEPLVQRVIELRP